MKKRNSERSGNRPLRGGEPRNDGIEAAIIRALAPLENTPDFEELISKTNDYNQTLAHFAVDTLICLDGGSSRSTRYSSG